MEKLTLCSEITGYEFNEIYKNRRFYKFLNDDLTHFGFRYVIGLNKDHLQFKPTDTCSSGGLYFCEESECHLYWNMYGHKIAYIEIPLDARIYVVKNKFKTDKLLVKKIVDFNEIHDGFWENIMQHNSLVLKYIKKQTEELCKIAVQRNSMALEFVKEQHKTEEMCKLAVQQNGYALQYVKTQTDEICKLAVRKASFALEFVNKQKKYVK